MALTNVELYEVLRDKIGEKAARLMADAIPAASDLARKDDISRVMLAISELKADMMRWMLTFFVPLWIATWGTLLAVLLKR